MHKQTTSQTVGPFFHDALIEKKAQNDLTTPATQGERLLIQGCVLDGDNTPVVDAMVEIWQADANGRFNHPTDPNQPAADPAFAYFGRSACDEDGRYWFKTVMPGRIGSAAPYINVRLFARGMLIHAVTRIYFADTAEGASLLNQIDSDRRHTLIAQLISSADLPTYSFDIVLQGPNETVFFDV